MRYLCVMFMLACEAREDGDQIDRGAWLSVRPPPDAPSNLVCWIWTRGDGQYQWGPTCFTVEDR